MGVPGSGKTTTARALAEHWNIPYLHSSNIVRDALRPGRWAAESGLMAPEPAATIAVEKEVANHPEFILDGYPRSGRQLKSPFIEADTIVFLELKNRLAYQRALKRGRMPAELEAYRIEEQSRLLIPVKAMAAVLVPVQFQTPSAVIRMVIDWYELAKYPAKNMGE